MKINDVGDYTLKLLKEYLPNNYHEWEVEFFGSKEIAGKCFCYRKIIQISTFVVKHGTAYQIQDVVKHEVAHAIAFHIDNNCIDHGDLWKYICDYMGCTGTLSVSIDENYDSEDINYSINLTVLMSSMTNEKDKDNDYSSLPW